MNQAARLEIFQAQTQNVRRLALVRSQVRRAVNVAIRRGDAHAQAAHTLVLSLLYCAWLEALFSKIVHTPYGFDLDDIAQISSEQSASGIHEAWGKAIELGLQKLPRRGKSADIPNIRQRLMRLVRDYVQDPAQLRNKIAHGQWAVALNRERTAINAELTARMQTLDIVTLDRWYEVAGRLADIVEALIESPERHFRKAYWQHLTELEAKIEEMSTWTIASRVEHLRKKPIPPTMP